MSRDSYMRSNDDARRFTVPEQTLHLNYLTEKAPIYSRNTNSAMTVKKVNSYETHVGSEGGDVLRPPKSGTVTPVALVATVAKPTAVSQSAMDRMVLPETSLSTHTVFRNADERAANPDRLNLDRRRLLFCPFLEAEDDLRLLNYQHNLISKIENMSNLRRLIFLDLYDNDIHEIANLECLRSLRVLMLGKNRISRIQNLDTLIKLDVLDLHGNRISVIENLSHLCDLRVLNLAGNVIGSVANLTGMDSLTELNLRRNKIRTVNEIDMLPCLQRLFLSFNDISSLDDIQCVFDCTSLAELAIDGNPVTQMQQYKYHILRRAPHLIQLDMKRIMDDEKRNALVMGRKEEEKKREFTKMSVMKEKRRQAISNAKRQWEVMQSKVLSHSGKVNVSRSSTDVQAQHVATVTTARETLDSHRSCEKNSEKVVRVSSPRLCNRGDNMERSRPLSACTNLKETMTFQMSDNDKQHLAQLEGDTLSLYGQGALEALERNWGVQAAGTITTVEFRFMDFDEIAKNLHKLRYAVPMICGQTLVFNSTNISSLRQLHGLTSVRRLEHLNIQEDGNPITSLSLWTLYAIFRLSSYDLKTINNIEVTDEQIAAAALMFSDLTSEASKLPDMMLHCVLNEQQKKAATGTDDPVVKDKKTASGKKRDGKAVLVYNIVGDKSKTEDKYTLKGAAARLIAELTDEAIYNDRKRRELERVWPQIFCDMVAKAVCDMSDMKQYMKACMEHTDRG